MNEPRFGMPVHMAREFESTTNRALLMNGCSRAARYNRLRIVREIPPTGHARNLRQDPLTEIRHAGLAVLRAGVSTERVDENCDVDEPGL